MDAQLGQEDGVSTKVDAGSTKKADRSTVTDIQPSIEGPKKTVKKDL